MQLNYTRSNLWLFVLYSVLFYPDPGCAQSPTVRAGTVLSIDRTVVLEGVAISNLTRNIRELSDNRGNFSILCSPGDSLELRADGWNTVGEVAEDLPDTILLTRTRIQLDQVIVFGRSGNSTLQNLKNIAEENNKKNGIYYQGKPPIALLSPFGGKPITFFYELLSKHGKHARKMSQTIAKGKNDEKVDEFFNVDLIQSIVPLSNAEVNEFMDKFRPHYEQVRAWTSYDSHVYIKNSYAAYTAQQRDKK
ncbi:MAG: hypothetical protein ACTJHT_07980 [Sphingobacterium sp.]|uniref:hypothetical protein n=1 Tax=Sphingobacterium sp. JB170 TaxID=1434842 RepID=UPI000B34DD8B|nr:hypothetical protein [Sphingobacterium sp. JB170]